MHAALISVCLYLIVPQTYVATTFDWNTFRDSINTEILNEGFAEDHCIGYWFFSETEMNDIEKYTKASVEMRNETGTHELSTMQNPLVDKLFAYLLQDGFPQYPFQFLCGKYSFCRKRKMY